MVNTISTVVGYLKPFKKYAILNVVLNSLSTVFSLFSMAMIIPFLDMLFKDMGAEVPDPGPWRFDFETMGRAKEFLDYFLYQVIITDGKLTALMYIGLFVIIGAFFKNFFGYMGSFYMAPISNGTVMSFQRKIYYKILDLPLRYFSESKKGDILSRFTSDVQEIRSSISGSLDMLFKDPIQIVLYLGTLIYTSWELTIGVLFVLPVIALLIGRLGKSLKSSSGLGQAAAGEMLTVMEETLGGLRIVKAFIAEHKMKERFEKINDKFYRLQNKVSRKHSLSSPLSEFLGIAVFTVVLVGGGYLILQGKGSFTSSEFIFFLAVFSQLLNPAKDFARTFNTIQKGMASLDRVNKILDETMHVPEIENPVRINDFKESIEFRNVSFKYAEKYVLRNINLKIQKGKTVALVGQSGSGKSTLVDLLPRFWDIEEGEILIDGINIKDYKLTDLRSLMGNVNQESILFNDTIRNNIAFGVESATDEEVSAAAAIANATEFIDEKPEKYDTGVGDRGSKLSGGQRQRISIARAVLKNPPILILDEATSALDTESERLVQDALSKLMKNRTSIVIAHRLSTVKDADEICVLNDGEIIERGTHEQLMEQNGAYHRLCDLQMF
ncbi:MAG: ATP-binding cassette domain-containing protein [Bacteroidales bacterium]|nr:ATP-binding cassette domain-containing protein [Bacteroidales bacterium]